MSRVLFVRAPMSHERGLAYALLDEIAVVDECGHHVGRITGADDRGMLRFEIADEDLATRWRESDPRRLAIEGRVRLEPAKPAGTVKP